MVITSLTLCLQADGDGGNLSFKRTQHLTNWMEEMRSRLVSNAWDCATSRVNTQGEGIWQGKTWRLFRDAWQHAAPAVSLNA